MNYFKESIIVPKNALSKVKKSGGAQSKANGKVKPKRTPKKPKQPRGAQRKANRKTNPKRTPKKPNQEEFMKYLQNSAPKKVKVNYHNIPIEKGTKEVGKSQREMLLNTIPNYFKMESKYKVFNLINIFKKKPSIIDIKDNFSVIINGVHYPETSIIEIIAWLIDHHYTDNYFTEDEVVKFVLKGKVPKETGRFAWALQEIISPKTSLKPMISDFKFKEAKLIFNERKRYLEEDEGIFVPSDEKQRKDRRFLERAMDQTDKEKKERRRAREFERDAFDGVKDRRRARQFTEGDLAAFQKYMKELDGEQSDEDEDKTLVAEDEELEGVEELLKDKDADAATNFLLANAGRGKWGKTD